jgi:hypothetical protein
MILAEAARMDADKVILSELDEAAKELAAAAGTDGWHTVMNAYSAEARAAVDSLQAEKNKAKQGGVVPTGIKTPAIEAALARITQAMENFENWVRTEGEPDYYASNGVSFGQLMRDFELAHKKMKDRIAGALPYDDTSIATDYAKKQLFRADQMWEDMRGSLPVSRAMAERVQSARSFLTGVMLGGAWLSSLTDPGFGQDARVRFGMGMAKAGVPRIIAAVMKEMLEPRAKWAGVDDGLGLEAGARVFRQKAGEEKGLDHRFWTDYLGDRTLSIGLLSPWTQAGKHVVGRDIMSFLAQASDWKSLPERTRDALELHGIGAQQWAVITSTPRKGGLLRPTEVRARDRAIGELYAQMIHRETRFAVPEGTVTARTLWQGQARSGTGQGEVIKSMMQFKGFGASIVMLRATRIAYEMQKHGGPQAMGREAALLVTLAILGAAALAMKDVKSGRDPRRWLDEKTYIDPKMWGAALLQSGGFGIYGDFLFSETSRFGGGLEKTIAGPLIGRAGDALELTVGTAVQLAKGEKTNFGRKAAQFGAGMVPGQFWFSSLLLQRTVFDRLQRIADPDAQAAFNREIQRRQKDFGQKYWWPPGTPSPQRGPDFGRLGATR